MSQNLDSFRVNVRQWLQENCPPSMRTPMPESEVVWGGRNGNYSSDDSKDWLERMIAQRWVCPTWPKQYGGGGLSNDEAQVLEQEMRAINARPALRSYGISMLGPVLLEYGNELQKQQHLTAMTRAEIRWCQGYSEPNAGSDLASVQLKAEDMGDHYLLNGSKIWTSNANESDWIFCLVRTDPHCPKHEGISFLLVDMTSEGVSTRPIELISGASVFCQTFFDNVSVAKDNLVGKPGEGWQIAKKLLYHERKMVSAIGGSTALGGRGRRLEELAKSYAGEEGGKIADPVLRDKIVQHAMTDKAFQLTLSRNSSERKAGNANPNSASMFKLVGTEQNQLKYELMLQSMGTQAFGWEGEGFDDREKRVTRQWLRSKANTIEGGTSEIQLNIIAKQILKLPE
ncbi:MAG: alkylation response protein AidB-like acyl-CoA dehydrogenase [Marinomonas primoryensis]|jgi:alkylation response protein AidB-like acyl-CoA dehydrogenase